jgi:hypothetical protein
VPVQGGRERLAGITVENERTAPRSTPADLRAVVAIFMFQIVIGLAVAIYFARSSHEQVEPATTQT